VTSEAEAELNSEFLTPQISEGVPITTEIESESANLIKRGVKNIKPILKRSAKKKNVFDGNLGRVPTSTQNI
jgi:hypothetical protein